MQDILIVEDGHIERQRLQRALSEAGYSVIACETVGEAEAALRRESFRLAIIDIGLADKSGSYLFGLLKRGTDVSYILVLTGNPSVHLKQRFMEEGALDYIVKGTPPAQMDALVQRVRDVIGDAQPQAVEGLDLAELLERYLPEKSRRLFLDMEDRCPACKGCGSREYVVSFARHAQMPPEITGIVVCKGCGAAMDPDLQ